MVTNQPSWSGTNIPRVTLILQGDSEMPGADPNKGIYTYIYTNSVFTNFIVDPSSQPNGIENFLSVTNKFTDIREYQTNMFVTQINVGAYASWVITNYSDDLRKFATSSLPPSFTWRTGGMLGQTSFLWCASSMPINCPSITIVVGPWPPQIRYTSRAITT